MPWRGRGVAVVTKGPERNRGGNGVFRALTVAVNL
jgi:hypothetical protein